MNFIEHLSFWHWWIIAAILVVMELATPGTAYFLWMGVAAGVTGLVLLLAPTLTWAAQALIFSVVAVLIIKKWRGYETRYQRIYEQSALNRRAQQYVDRIFTLTEPVINHCGTLRLDDTQWKIAGADMPPGTRVRVIGVDGVVLNVVKLDQ